VNTDRWLSCWIRLIDEVGEDESHPLASLMEIVGVPIQNYEDHHVRELTGT
jgi:HTH-type transcriptional regulator/antitoxin HigA